MQRALVLAVGVGAGVDRSGEAPICVLVESLVAEKGFSDSAAPIVRGGLRVADELRLQESALGEILRSGGECQRG
ncbi:MAG: hypothetical protein ACM336_20440 [Acidobacteriota bacterium]